MLTDEYRLTFLRTATRECVAKFLYDNAATLYGLHVDAWHPGTRCGDVHQHAIQEFFRDQATGVLAMCHPDEWPQPAVYEPPQGQRTIALGPFSNPKIIAGVFPIERL